MATSTIMQIRMKRKATMDKDDTTVDTSTVLEEEADPSNQKHQECPTCFGKGYIADLIPIERGTFPVTHECETCDGQGIVTPPTLGHLVLFSLLS
jgi:DnaJ-class molecular chaperone